MSAIKGPNIITDDLVLALDAANTRSFRGEPTTNLAANGGLIGMSGITLTYIDDENGWKKYSMSGTFTGGTYPYIMHVTSVSFTGGLQYTTRCVIKTNAIDKFNYFGTGTGMNYVNVPMTNSGAAVSIFNPDGSYTVGRTGFIYTSSTTQPGYILSNPINNTTFNSSTDFVWIRDLQVEQKAYPTPFVNGTRGTTVATGGGWADLTGNGNHGQLVNGPTYNNSNLGSLAFDGIDDYISNIPNSGITHGTNNFSYFAWANLQGKPGLGTIFENGSWTNCLLIRYETDGITIYSMGSYWGKFSFNPSLNTWNHLGFIRNGNFIEFYVNGVYQTNISFTANISPSSNIFIGTSQHATTQVFNGYISIAQIYNRALTSQEVLQNYNATKRRYGL